MALRGMWLRIGKLPSPTLPRYPLGLPDHRAAGPYQTYFLGLLSPCAWLSKYADGQFRMNAASPAIQTFSESHSRYPTTPEGEMEPTPARYPLPGP